MIKKQSHGERGIESGAGKSGFLAMGIWHIYCLKIIDSIALRDAN
jgi:hypothetical protein